MSRKTNSFPKDPHAYGSEVQQDRTFVRATVHNTGVLTSDGSGNIFAALSLDPSAGAGTDWGDFNATYDEFRVMGVRITFTSVAPNANNANYLGCIAFDNDSAAVPSSVATVRQYATSSLIAPIFTTGLQTRTYWRPSLGVETPLLWSDVANPSGSLGSIQIAISSLSVSTQYLSYAIDMYIEFRGRR